MLDKSSIRRHALRIRDSLSIEQKTKKDQAIANTLRQLKIYRSAERILFYVSFGSEVDTLKLISEELDRGRFLAVPKVVKEKGTLRIHRITALSSLKPGVFGILEPVEDCPTVDVGEVDLVIVPGVAFDTYKNRLGYGKGYYDRLLANMKGLKADKEIAIAIAYEEQIVDRLPTEPHDIKVDLLVTDERVI